ncbi:MAG TPA: hypothetical protein VHO06_24875 [Polyangia bacterium]|nr:hypothetical protein [Polyangia bacterium]
MKSEAKVKRATVYLRKNGVFVHSLVQTTDGVWLLWQPCLAVPRNNENEIELAVRSALDGSRTGVPHPRSWTGLLDPLLAVAAVKTWSAFSKGASCVEVEEHGSLLVVIPMKNLGPRDGFQAETSQQVVIEIGDRRLGAVVLKMLESAVA